MNIEKVWEELTSYRGDLYFNERHFINESDLITLKAWLSSIVVPFQGFKGKVHFAKTTNFPRYKFTEYSRENNNIVRRVRDMPNADAVILDVPMYEDALKYCSNNIKTYTSKPADIGVNSRALPGEKVFTHDITSTMHIGFLLWSKNNSHYVQISYLMWLYDNYQKNNFKIISVYDLAQSLGESFEPIDSSKAEQLTRLFKSQSQDDIKLGMEIMTNCDLDASYFHICLLFTMYGGFMKSNSYWNSTSFKSFRETVDEKGLTIYSLMNMTILKTVERYLTLDDKFIFDDDIIFIKKLVFETIESQFNLENNGYKLKNYEIELNIDPTKIIKNPNVSIPDEQPVESESSILSN